MNESSFNQDQSRGRLYPDHNKTDHLVAYPDEDERGGITFKEEVPRAVAELKEILENQERRKIKKDIFDESGKKLCAIEIDPEDGKIVSVLCEPYINVEESAEHPDEKIYVTDEDGQPTQERLTRREAREQKKRYLIVTNLIFHGEDLLIQKRAVGKKIDPDKLSSSAHGVAKEVFYEGGKRIDDGQMAALINSALEINEELRHGEAPFKIRIWPGAHDELHAYAEKEKINNSNTIFVVPEAYLPDDGYPLYTRDEDKQRTRAIAAGFIFSKERPYLSIDPSELQECRWQTTANILKEQESFIATDLPPVAIKVLERILRDSPYGRRYGMEIFENMLRRMQGLKPYEKP